MFSIFYSIFIDVTPLLGDFQKCAADISRKNRNKALFPYSYGIQPPASVPYRQPGGLWMSNQAIFRELVNTIQEKDRLCRTGAADYNMLMVGFFLCPMDARDKEVFASHGWEIVDLPRNPHTQEST